MGIGAFEHMTTKVSANRAMSAAGEPVRKLLEQGCILDLFTITEQVR
jgi:hypothetical protein